MSARPMSMRHATRQVDIGLSFNGVDIRSHDLQYEYEPPVEVFSISPKRGGTEGGTLVVVYGSGFTARAGTLQLLHCMFNSTRVTAVRISSGEIHCRSPPHAEGHAAFEVTNNRQQFSTSGQLYEYQTYVLQRLEPLSGPVLGGTRMHLELNALPGLTDLHCSFGGQLSAASAIARDSVVCTSPPDDLTTGRSVHVSLTSAGAWLTSSASFVYRPEIDVVHVYPPFGPAAGTTDHRPPTTMTTNHRPL